MDKLREMLSVMEDNLGILGDIIGGLCLMLTLYGVLLFALVL